MAEEKIKKGPDAFQQKAIDSIKNTVVSAGAGSGKTSTLSSRFLNLIQKHKYNVDEILTLTFTKKATVEMSSRIFSVLQENEPEQAANFYKSSIMTLDSYCEKIAKRGAQFYGLSPDFSVDDETVKEQVQNLAVPFVLKHRDSSIIRLNVSSENFRENALSLFVDPILKASTVAKPIDLKKSVDMQKKYIIQKWEELCKTVSKNVKDLKNIYDNFDGNTDTAFFKSFAAVEDDMKNFNTVLLTENDLINGERNHIFDFYQKLNIISSIKAPGNSSFTNKEAYKELRESIINISETFSELMDYIKNLPLLVEYLILLDEFQTEYNNMKRKLKLLTFDDVSALALDTLITHPEIRLLEKQKYKAIMIDEFQDNNQMQRDMLFLLAERIERNDCSVPSIEELCPSKLFFVGDEKQSIYRFRGADVEVFRKLSDDFKEGNLEMSINYRSHQALIASFNTIFGGKFYPPVEYFPLSEDELKMENVRPSVFTSIEQKEEGKPVPSYDAIYHRVTLPDALNEETKKLHDAGKIEELSDLYNARVHIAIYDKDKYSEEETENCLTDEEAEAEWVSRKILELTSPDENGNINYRPKDIAILMRTTAVQSIYERTFLKHGIPYNTEALTGLFSDGPVNDIILFLNLIVNSRDEDSYRKVLHSPFVNLSFKTITSIQSLKEPAFSTKTEEILSGQELIRYRLAEELFEKARLYAQQYSITKLISFLWYESGYCYETKWNHKVERYAQLYDYIFELARKAEDNYLSLSAFIDDVSQYRNQKLKDMEIPIEKIPGVSIMTIHKSKGLEFEVVFVVATHKGQINKSEPLAFYSKNYGISVKVPDSKNHFYEMTKKENAVKEKAELKRVTYVALTRAKKELFITIGKYPVTRSQDKTIFGLLEPVIRQYMPDSEKSDQETENKTPVPFDFYDIEPVPLSETVNTSSRLNTIEAKAALIEEISRPDFFDGTEILEPSSVVTKYVFPSKFHEMEESEELEDETAEAVLYPEVDEIINATRPQGLDINGKKFPPKFSHADFGTIAHAYNEALINGEEPHISNRDLQGLSANEQYEKNIKEICSRISEDFRESEYGRQALNSKWHKAEYSFRCRISNKIVKGTIDLVYQNQDGTYTVLDYKTNKKAKPEIYFHQLACYRKAVSDMLGIEKPETIKCVLYYLRLGKAIDISSSVDKIDIVQVVKQLEESELQLSSD